MPRRYVQRQRAAAAAETRIHVLDAARRTLLDADRLVFSVGQVADAAGVARSTVYAVFGSRAGLLAALADDTLRRAGLDEVIASFLLPDPIQALDLSLRASCRMYGAGQRPIRRLLALGEVDPEAAAPITRSNSDRAMGMSSLAERLAAAGRLRPGLTPDRAADLLSLATSFGAFDELVAQRGLDVEAAADLLTELVRDTVLS